MIRSALALLALACLAGCGFQPAYAPASTGASLVKIPEIEGRTGHFLRQELVRAVGRGVPGAADAGQLTVTIKEGVEYVGFRPDQASSRADYVATAQWSLVSTTGEVLAGGVANEAASFNFAGLAYNDVAAQTAAQERVALALSRTIRQEIMLQIRSQRTKAAP
jgi:LPS-assembly lipoprotein